MDNTARTHRVRVTKNEYLENKTIFGMKFLAMYPDLNPIELVLEILQERF